jgi:hypothetical protein
MPLEPPRAGMTTQVPVVVVSVTSGGMSTTVGSLSELLVTAV